MSHLTDIYYTKFTSLTCKAGRATAWPVGPGPRRGLRPQGQRGASRRTGLAPLGASTHYSCHDTGRQINYHMRVFFGQLRMSMDITSEIF